MGEDSTGDAIVTCEANSKYCPTADVDYEVKEIYAYGCDDVKEEESASKDGGCGHDGYMMKTRNSLTKVRNVETACRCESMCFAMDRTSHWQWKKKNQMCQCIALNKRGRKS